MFSTDKEVHIYVEQSIQNAGSNRKQSIPAPFIDMVLNNAVLEYISSKFPDKQNPRDIEATLKRYTDFNILKTSVIKIFEEGHNIRKSVITKLPYNCLKFQTGICSYKRSVLENYTENKNKHSVLLTFDESSFVGSTLSFSFKYLNNDGILINDSISFDDVISEIKSKEGIFYLYNTIIDRFRNILKLDCKFESVDKNGKKVLRIDFLIGEVVDVFTTTASYITITKLQESVKVIKQIGNKNSSISIASSIDCQITLDDYYGSKNLYLNPIGELSNGNLILYHTDFIPTKIEINYIRKPKLFDISSGQIPEIEINKDFLDYAIKELLLILNSQNYEKVLNETYKTL